MLAQILGTIFAGALFGIERYKRMLWFLLAIWLIIWVAVEIGKCF